MAGKLDDLTTAAKQAKAKVQAARGQLRDARRDALEAARAYGNLVTQVIDGTAAQADADAARAVLDTALLSLQAVKDALGVTGPLGPILDTPDP